MPNQPKTPARTFRLSDETMEKVETLMESTQASSRSDVIRDATEAMWNATEALKQSMMFGVSVEAIFAAQGAIEATSGLHVPDADIAMALSAARPFLDLEKLEEYTEEQS